MTSVSASAESNQAATCIQMHCRTYLERKKEQAITVIQNAWRNYAARTVVEKHLLPISLFEKAIPLVKQLSDFPQAYDGRKPVYYLPDMPVVVKQCEKREKSWQMFEEMNSVRKVCVANGFKHVCIPRARTHGELLLVKRVFFSSYTKVQIGLYLENHDRFTKAVKEFARLYFETTLPDLVDSELNPEAYKSAGDGPYDFMLGRYDNLVFRIKNGVGKLVPIDVEGFSSEADPRHSVEKCEGLISLFPMHPNEVFAAALNYDPQLSSHFTYFEKQRKKVLHCFKVIYNDHLDFIRRKKIPLYRPARFDVFSVRVMRKLPHYLSTKLKREDDADGPFMGCLKTDSLTQFKEKFFPPLATELHTLIQTYLIVQVKEDGPIRSMEELVNARTLHLPLSLVVKDLRKKLPSLDIFNLDSHEKDPFLERLVHLFFKGLVKYDHIAYNKRDFGFTNRIQCLFC